MSALGLIRRIRRRWLMDPVARCHVHKTSGCAHVDGPLCDFPKCTMRHDALRALRSGEAGKDAIYGGEHAAAEIPAILAAHPGYTLPSSHDF